MFGIYYGSIFTHVHRIHGKVNIEKENRLSLGFNLNSGGIFSRLSLAG